MSSPSQFGRTRLFQAIMMVAFVASLIATGCSTSNPMVAPTFTSGSGGAPPTSTDFTVGTASSFTFTAMGSPAPTLTESGALPMGVMFNDPTATATLAGTPAAGSAGNYPITITATNGVGTPVTLSFTLTVVLPPVATSLTPAKSTITAGTSTTLTPVFSAGTGSVTPGPIAVTSGTAVTVTPAATTIYTLTVTNAAGTTATVQTTVTVVPPPSITSFTAAKATITVGTSTTLTGVFVGTGSIDNSIGAVTTGTAVTITPAVTTTYTLTVTNAAGATPVAAMVTVAVVPLPTIASFVAGAASITGGTSTTLTATFNAGTGGTASVNNNVGAVISGTPVTVSPAVTTTYTLTVTNAAGTAVTMTATVTVVPAPVITSFTAVKTTITAGASTMLTAVFTGGTGLVDNSIGAVTSNTPVTITPAVTTIYTLTVTNTLGATATQTATVTVVPPPTITSFLAGSSPIVVGSSTSLTPIFAAGSGGTASVNNNVGAVISGTVVTVSPAVTTTYTLTVTNAAGTAITAMATVVVDVPPQITSANHATFSVGVLGTFTVTTTGFPIPSVNDGGATLPNGIMFQDNGDGTATLSGTPAAGTAAASPYLFTIAAGNGVGSNATQPFTLTVNTAPGFTSATSTTFTVGAMGTFSVTAGGNPAPALTQTGGTLPTGVLFTPGTGTATLAGTPAAGTGNTYVITFTATNTSGTTTQTFTLTVDQAPAITTANNATFPEGTFSSFTVMTTGFPKPALSDGTSPTLPTGVMFHDNGDGTATLSGTPAAGTAAGSPYTFTITASNGVGTNATQPFTLTVNTVPVFSSGTSTTFTVGTAGTFPVTASGAPTFVVTSGTLPGGSGCTGNACLPSGVSLTSGGTLSGTPAAATGGTYQFTIQATNTSGSTNQSFTLTVNQAPVFNSNTSATFVLGQLSTFTVSATGFPTSITFSDNGATLPSGVNFNTSTGVLSGTPGGSAQSYPITFTATNTTGSTNQSFTLTVISDPCAGAGTGSESLLNGQYAWLTTGFDNGTTPEPALVGGVLTFNGTGTITAGTLDQNLNSTHGVQSLTVTGGTYKVGTDRRACLSITTSQGTVHYRVSLNGAGTIGHVINFDVAGPFTSGVMKKQTTPFASSVSGTFAFELSSPQNTVASAGGNSGVIGAVTFSSSTITGGEEDINDEGQLEGSSSVMSYPATAPITLTGGTITVSTTSGRATFTVNGSQGGSTFSSSSVGYVVSPSDILLMTNTDQTQTNGFFAAGEALKQSGSFSLGSLNGNSVLYSSALNTNSGPGSSNPPTSNATIGVVTANGSGSITTGTMYQLQGGNGNCSGCSTPSLQQSSVSGVTYSTPDSFGRVILTTGDNHPPVLYLVGQNAAFFMGGSQSVEVGMFEDQTSAAAPSGTFAFGEILQEADNSINDGVATFGSGTVSGTTDNDGPASSGGLQADQTFSSMNVSAGSVGLGLVSGTTSACQIQLTGGSTVSNPCQLIFYVINSGRAVLLNIANGQGTSVPQNPNLQTADQ